MNGKTTLAGGQKRQGRMWRSADDTIFCFGVFAFLFCLGHLVGMELEGFFVFTRLWRK
jgi:hypothetical protein